jgi:3',5'-cyclic AMP phosphodiesterase CpdA
MLKVTPKSFIRPSLFLVPIFVISLLGSVWILSHKASAPESKPANTTSQEPFTIVALPDTQVYSRLYPDIFMKQTQWILDNQKTRNIVFVTHLGDIVDDNTEEQWQNASKAMAVLDGKIPYAVAPGNHDMEWGGNASLFDKHFPLSRLKQSPSWGGSFLEAKGAYEKTPHNGNKSNYHLFSAGGTDYLSFNLQFCPTSSELEWTANIMETYKFRRTIIATHSFLDHNGNRTTFEECAKYQHEGNNAGQEIWDHLVSKRKLNNLFLILNGHNIDTITGGSRRTDLVNDKPVHQLFSDYQYLFGHNSGYLRIMTFSPKDKKIQVQTYSPSSNTYLDDKDNKFELSM